MKRKSTLAAIFLTALFGPLGLFYVSAWQAVIAVVAWLLVVPGSFVADPGTGAVVAWVFWGLVVLAGWSAASEHNKEIVRVTLERDRKHQEVVAAIQQIRQRQIS